VIKTKYISIILLLSVASVAQTDSIQLPSDDACRIREFYRLAAQVQDKVWPGWSQTPAPLLLITPSTEFLTQFLAPPKDFKPIGDGFSARPRQFPTTLLATFPAFGPPSGIVVGEPVNTDAKTSTPWLITRMHEHFHQMQNGQPGYYEAVQKLGLSRGDNTGMWMLNYPFPYDKPEVAQSFGKLRDELLAALGEPDPTKFKAAAEMYIEARKKFFAQLAPDDRKYLSFQLWQEGIARYTQIKVAEAAAGYEPTKEYAALADYGSFASYAPKLRVDTLTELRTADLAHGKRRVVYSFGAGEGLLLDRMNPDWESAYFQHLCSLDPLFDMKDGK
jgi:hypothetical protein